MSTSRDSIIMPIIIVAFNCLLLIECLPNNNRVSLHSLMTDKELLRYFDVDNPDEVSDAIYEVVEIAASPSSRSKRDLRSRDEIQLKVSGKHLRLNLEPNEDLLYEEARVLSVSSSAEEEIIESGVNASRSCHYRVRDLASNSITGGLSDLTGGECDGRNLFGFVYDSEEILEIHPLGEDLKEKAGINRRSHLIKKKPAKSVFELGDEIDKRAMSGNNKLIIELAIFVDVFAYKNLIDFYGGEQTKLVDLVLALVNGVEGIYRYPSLGREVQFCIVHVELHKSVRFDEGQCEREPLLFGFCAFQKKKMQSHETGWDLALLLSGCDMFGIEPHSKRKSYGTMGLSTVTGVCEEDYGCVIAEIGVVDEHGLNYPSTGYLAVYVIAHEIGHNLGMNHDSKGNDCSHEGFVMSPTRGLEGETGWSHCSRDLLVKLDLACLKNHPGQVAVDHLYKFRDFPGFAIDAKAQCEFASHDHSATVANSGREMCRGLECVSRGKDVSAGLALDGTSCRDDGDWICYQGGCVKKSIPTLGELDNGVKVEEPSWTEWSPGSCKRPCIKGSIAVSTRTRACRKGGKTVSVDFCPGESKESDFCLDPESNCQEADLISADDFASFTCDRFRKESKRLEIMVEANSGSQNEDHPCDISCKLASSGYFAPVKTFLPKPVKHLSEYFPDGTECTKVEGQTRYCMSGKCVDKNNRAGRSGGGFSETDDREQDDIVPKWKV